VAGVFMLLQPTSNASAVVLKAKAHVFFVISVSCKNKGKWLKKPALARR
jgi:hypothetical protein